MSSTKCPRKYSSVVAREKRQSLQQAEERVYIPKVDFRSVLVVGGWFFNYELPIWGWKRSRFRYDKLIENHDAIKSDRAKTWFS